MKLADIAAEMRAAGVRRLELEIFDAPETLPAPPLDVDDPTEEAKPAGACAHAGCLERAGFHFAPALCAAHGMAALGVKDWAGG